MRRLQLTNLAEELQEYISDNVTGLSVTYTMAENFVLGRMLNVQDLDDLVGQNIDLTLFDEGGPGLVPGSRVVRQERTFRFVHRGDGQQAVTRAQELLEWLWNRKSFQTATFRVWVAQPAALPSAFRYYRSGDTLADFLMNFYAFNLT